jgi:capsular polysaccharide biosynthesis protein
MLLENGRGPTYFSEETKIVAPAIKLSKSIKSNKRLNLIIATILGLFIGFCYAFIAEYWQKNKIKFKEQLSTK